VRDLFQRAEQEGLRLVVILKPNGDDHSRSSDPGLGWRAADRMWRIAGDRATDFNHYSKRAILMGVYGSTSLVYLDDDSDGLAATRAFLDRRLGDVMRFEKLKAGWRGSRERLPSLSRFLGRLRYPAV